MGERHVLHTQFFLSWIFYFRYLFSYYYAEMMFAGKRHKLFLNNFTHYRYSAGCSRSKRVKYHTQSVPFWLLKFSLWRYEYALTGVSCCQEDKSRGLPLPGEIFTVGLLCKSVIIILKVTKYPFVLIHTVHSSPLKYRYFFKGILLELFI